MSDLATLYDTAATPETDNEGPFQEEGPVMPDSTTLYDTRATLKSLNCSRWKLWRLCSTDDTFPRPRIIAGKNQWYAWEIEDYKADCPRREYGS